jgi:RNA polymerase sigma factor (sigma-70 family)
VTGDETEPAAGAALSLPSPGGAEATVENRVYRPLSAAEEARLLDLAWRARAAGRRAPVRALVTYLEPKIRLCAGDVLRAHGRAEEVATLADLKQAGWAGIFADDWSALRRWRPDAGARLISFAGLLATRRMIDELRQDHRWARNREEGLLEASAAVEDFHRQLELRNMIEVFVISLEQEISPSGFAVFQSLYLRQRSAEATSRELGMTKSAVHSHHKRVKKAVRAVWSRLFPDAGPP